MKEFNECRLCPRACGARRDGGEHGICGGGATLRVARAALHMWEEPCISGNKGSGAVFFSGCPLHCIYCQNAEISERMRGKDITVDRLADIFSELQEQGAANINLVTAGHYAPLVANALAKAKQAGLTLPCIWNSGGYETIETIDMLAPYIDVYLPDLKYLDKRLAAAFSHAEDYPEVATKAIGRMVELAGEPTFDEQGYITKGVIVRHLVLPGHVEESKRVISYLRDTYGDKIFVSILQQYTPPKQSLAYAELNRRVTRYEYAKVVDFARDIGLEQGYIQEHGTALESFIPAFDENGV